MGDGEEMTSSNGRLLSKDVRHLETALDEFRKDIKGDIKALSDKVEKHIEHDAICRQETAVEIATLKQQVRQGDEKATTIATIISSLTGAITGMITAILGNKSS